MKRQFLGATLEIPSDWSDRSVALFVAPARKPNFSMPTLTLEAQIPEMTISLSPARPSTLAPADEVDEVIKRIAAHADVNVLEKGSSEIELQHCAWAKCDVKMPDGKHARQIIASVHKSGTSVGFTGSADASSFAEAQNQMMQILASVRVDVQPS